MSKATQIVAPTNTVASASTIAGGSVLVECVAEKGGKLRVRPITAGYNADYNIQFPRDIRAAGARYVVDGLVEASSGGFYRATGNITRLVATQKFKTFVAATSLPVNQAVAAQGVAFKKGCAYYEHKRSETIQSYKALVIMDADSGELFEGDVARQLLGLPDDADATKVQPDKRHGDRFRFFVQSTSPNRTIAAGATFLFDPSA